MGTTVLDSTLCDIEEEKKQARRTETIDGKKSGDGDSRVEDLMGLLAVT